jgi:VanZ family protein
LERKLLTGARVALVLCAVLTGWGAFTPPGVPRLHLFPWDKAEHFSAFFALTACALAAFPRVAIVWIAVALSGCGALIELIQALPFVNRDADVKDWVADTLAVGAVAGVVVAARLRRRLAGGRS